MASVERVEVRLGMFCHDFQNWEIPTFLTGHPRLPDADLKLLMFAWIRDGSPSLWHQGLSFPSFIFLMLFGSSRKVGKENERDR
jgi:hypothetical protein